MQDLEELKAIAADGDIKGSVAIELIARCQKAEKERDEFKDLLALNHRLYYLIVGDRDSLRAELKELREQKPVVNEKIKEALLQAVMVVAYRAGDIDTEDGSYATTDTDSIIRLESALCDALGTQYDDIDLAEALALLGKLPVAQSRDSAEPKKEFPAEPTLEMYKVLKCWIKSGDELKFYQAMVNSLTKSNFNDHIEPAKANNSYWLGDEPVKVQQSPAVAVPDAMEPGDDTYDERASGYRHGWNDCRAAIMAAPQDEGKV